MLTDGNATLRHATSTEAPLSVDLAGLSTIARSSAPKQTAQAPSVSRTWPETSKNGYKLTAPDKAARWAGKRCSRARGGSQAGTPAASFESVTTMSTGEPRQGDAASKTRASREHFRLVLSKPTFLFEVSHDRNGNKNHQSKRVEVSVLPLEFGEDALEVHPVYPGH